MGYCFVTVPTSGRPALNRAGRLFILRNRLEEGRPSISTPESEMARFPFGASRFAFRIDRSRPAQSGSERRTARRCWDSTARVLPGDRPHSGTTRPQFLNKYSFETFG